MTDRKAAVIAELAQILRTSEGNALKRAHAMKLTPVCGRCGGCGLYSFNQVDGSTCYGCGGNGHVIPRDKDLFGVLSNARGAVAQGLLDQYLAERRARRVMKEGSKRIFAAWGATHASRIFNGWSSHIYDAADSGRGRANPAYAVPGNYAEMRAANSAMHELYQRADAAMTAARFTKPSHPAYGEICRFAAECVEIAVRMIPEHDRQPNEELVEFVRAKQRASNEASERGPGGGYFKPRPLYGEGDE